MEIYYVLVDLLNHVRKKIMQSCQGYQGMNFRDVLINHSDDEFHGVLLPTHVPKVSSNEGGGRVIALVT